MKENNQNPLTFAAADYRESSSSLIARAGQIMAIIISLGLVSMISSMLVTESLNGDAAQINKAGALRMQAVRISRAYFADTYLVTYSLAEESEDKKQAKKEIQDFDLRLSHLLVGQHLESQEKTQIELQYQNILEQWQHINDESLAAEHLSAKQLIIIGKDFDH